MTSRPSSTSCGNEGGDARWRRACALAASGAEQTCGRGAAWTGRCFHGVGTTRGFDADYDHTFGYTQANAIIDVSESAGHLTLTVIGDAAWTGQFDVMTGQSQITTGLYPALVKPTITSPTPLYDTAVGAFDWSGDGRGCNASTSWVAIDSVRYSGTELVAPLSQP